MDYLSLILIALSLAVDAFAVSICDGLCYKDMKKWQFFFIPVVFGLCQAIMPLIGYFVGSLFMGKITAYTCYIAFGLLLFIGGKMIFDAIKEYKASKKGEEIEVKNFSIGEVLLQGVATAIDALAVGITLHTLAIHIAVSVTIIGVITFGLVVFGVFIGKKAGALFKDKLWIATLCGGIVLIAIGVKILIEGLIG